MSRRRDPAGGPCGVLLIDKSPGSTSLDMVRRVRRGLGVKRVGHAGTLDPFATGLLPVCVGEATKAVSHLVEGTKVYEATARLGVETDSADCDGAVVATGDVQGIGEKEVVAAAARFVGRIEQIPPVYSAIRVDGKRAYEHARAGTEVEMPTRTVDVHRLTVQEVVGDSVRFEVECGAGTYIRSIARDLGRALGCHAHLIALRRTRVGALTIEDARSIDALESSAMSAALLGSEKALGHLPEVAVNEELAVRIRHGQKIPLAAFPRADFRGVFRTLDAAGSLVALCEGRDGVMRVIRGFNESW